MNPETIIIPFSAEWLEPCSGLYVQVFTQPPWNESWTIDAARRRLQRVQQRRSVLGFVAILNDQVVGCVLGDFPLPVVNSRLFHIREFFVDAACQGRGIGTLLWQELRTRLTTQQVRSISLVTRRGSPAERFYQKSGFHALFGGLAVKQHILMFQTLPA